MPSVEEELFLAHTQQARHQRVKCLCGEKKIHCLDLFSQIWHDYTGFRIDFKAGRTTLKIVL